MIILKNVTRKQLKAIILGFLYNNNASYEEIINYLDEIQVLYSREVKELLSHMLRNRTIKHVCGKYRRILYDCCKKCEHNYCCMHAGMMRPYVLACKSCIREKQRIYLVNLIKQSKPAAKLLEYILKHPGQREGTIFTKALNRRCVDSKGILWSLKERGAIYQEGGGWYSEFTKEELEIE